jgi:sugar-specific transcriptional regulator TrmB
MLPLIFQKLGLSDKEIRLYMASLGLGQCYASDLSRRTGINRSTVYIIAKQLCKKGLFTSYEKAAVRVFSPCPPESLINVFQNLV